MNSIVFFINFAQWKFLLTDTWHLIKTRWSLVVMVALMYREMSSLCTLCTKIKLFWNSSLIFIVYRKLYNDVDYWCLVEAELTGILNAIGKCCVVWFAANFICDQCGVYWLLVEMLLTLLPLLHLSSPQFNGHILMFQHLLYFWIE